MTYKWTLLVGARSGGWRECQYSVHSKQSEQLEGTGTANHDAPEEGESRLKRWLMNTV